jgi:myo-inositol 2-dehydrogenase / D-chiro-inositol 1-dehydrogenase
MSGHDTIRLAILGAGRIGQLHAGNILANPRAQLAYVYDPNPESAARLAARANAKVAAVSDILNAKDVDGVLITSPATSHISLLTATVRAGKPAFCEKPLSLDVAEAEDAVRSLKSAGARCMLGFHRRYDPQLQKARNSIISGAIGTLFQVTISSHSAAIPSDDYILNSGGLFRDQSIHDFDIARYLVGEEFRTVYAVGGCMIAKSIGELGDIDTAMITLVSQSGCQVHINNGRFSPFGYDQRVEMLGTKSACLIENVRRDTLINANENGFTFSQPVFSFIERYEKAYQAELEAFLRFVTNGSEPIADQYDGLQAQRLSEAALKSLRSGVPAVPDTD